MSAIVVLLAGALTVGHAGPARVIAACWAQRAHLLGTPVCIAQSNTSVAAFREPPSPPQSCFGHRQQRDASGKPPNDRDVRQPGGARRCYAGGCGRRTGTVAAGDSPLAARLVHVCVPFPLTTLLRLRRCDLNAAYAFLLLHRRQLCCTTGPTRAKNARAVLLTGDCAVNFLVWTGSARPRCW